MRRTVAVIVVASFLLSLAGGFAFARNPGGKDRDRIPPGQARKLSARERTEFRDAKEAEWADKHIRKLALKGVFQGFEDGTFRPNGAVQRVELITLAVRMLGREEEAKARMDEKLDYADWASVPKWAVGYVVVAHEQGLLRDLLREDGRTLQINSPATRLAVVVTMLRLMGLADRAREFPGGDLHFRDLEAIPAWARGFVALAIEEGILRGYEDRTFRPNQPVRRSEMAALLDRVEDWLDERDEDEDEDEDDDEEDDEDEDDDREFEGSIVTVVSGREPRITVANARHRDGKTFRVDADALIFLNGRRATLEDLQPGDKVEVILDDDEDNLVIFISAEFETRGVEGKLEAVADGKLTVLVQARSQTFPLDPAVKVFDEHGKLRDLAYLKAGQQVEVTLVRGVAVKVEVEKAEKARITGVVERVAEGTIVLQVAGASRSFPLDPAVKVLDEHGNRRDLTYVRAGQQVEITLVGGAVVEIRVKEIEITGVVERVADGTLTLQVAGASRSFPLSPTVKVLDEHGKSRDLAYVRAGQQVEVTLVGGAVVEIRVQKIDIPGVVERVADGTITLQVAGASRTFSLDPAVKTFDERGVRRDLTYVRAGQQVEITLVGGVVVEIRVK